jgi:hypothetical protein
MFIFVVAHSLESFLTIWVLLIDRFAFVEFKDEATAEKNLPILKKKKVGGNEIVVDYCGSKAINAPPQKPQKVRTEPGSYTVQHICNRLFEYSCVYRITQFVVVQSM